MALMTSGLILPPSAQAEILKETFEGSAFQKAVRKVELPGSGTVVHTIGEADFEVVAEGGSKPVSDGIASSKLVRAHTFAGIVLVTNQVAKDAVKVYEEIKAQAPAGMAKAFDEAVFGLTGPFADFVNMSGITEKVVTDYPSLLAAFKASKRVDTVVATRDFVWTLAGITDPAGRPIFDPNASTIFGKPILFTDAEGDFAVIGDFSRLVWGNVEGIEYLENKLGTVTKNGVEINLFQTNQTAIRIEGRFGINGDVSKFVKLVPTATV